MKKGLSITLIVLCSLILAALLAILFGDKVYILKGLNGSNGTNGQSGADGNDGQNGKSAYELALEDGFEGTLHEWLLSLAVRGTNGANGAPGVAGADGTGIKDVRIDNGKLLVYLTNGQVLNAGTLDEISEPDADGYIPVFEMVIMNEPQTSSLNLREGEGTSFPVVTSVSKGDEVLRVGINETTGYSRFLWNGKTCYAKSKYFELKYIYEGELPEVHLPDKMVLVKGEQAWFITDQIMPFRPANFYLSYSYSGKADRVTDGTFGYAVTPTDTGAAALIVAVQTYSEGEMRTLLEHRVEITVVEKQSQLSLTALLIGDSRISDGTIVSALKNTLPNLTLLGTRQFQSIPHEGRGGWSSSDYRKAESDSSGAVMQNPFYSPSTEDFDFSHYMSSNHAGRQLDLVILNLGANDGFSERSVENLVFMIESIHSFDPEIEILVLSEYLSPADGYYLSSGTNVPALRAKQFRYYTYQTEQLGALDRVHLLPNFLCIDGQNDWETSTVQTSRGEEERISDVIHLGYNGYRKEAAVIRAYIYSLFGTQ